MPLSAEPDTRSTGYDLNELGRACDHDVERLRQQFASFFFLRHTNNPALGPQTRSRTRMVGADEGEITGELTLRALPIWQAARSLTRPDGRTRNFVCIGRLAGNDVTLVDDTVSKLHAFCRLAADGCYLLDAGSRNGSFVDDVAAPGRASTGVLLEPGQTVRLGSLSMSFVEAETVLFLARRMRDVT